MPQTLLSPQLYLTSSESGVISLKNTGNTQASGALLWTGKHILTAAHFADDISNLSLIDIGFNTSLSVAKPQASSIYIHPGWTNNSSNYNHDIAIIELATEVSSTISRYDIYRDYDELNKVFTHVGYSPSVNPNTGSIINTTKSFHSGQNKYDTTTDQLNTLLGSSVLNNYQLSYDFDDGTSSHDAYGSILSLNDLGTGSNETFSNPGDSGGPALIDNKIAGISSYIFRYQKDIINPDITSVVDSSYGELASDTRVSKYTDWIDSIVLGSSYVQSKPSSASAVDLNPVEGDTQNTINYFLLQLGQSSLSDSHVQFETFDGTARAGSDYVSTSGQATIVAGQTTIAIAVEIIADKIDENNETFGLRVYQPVGGTFANAATELRVEHTIIDNDHLSSTGLIA